MVSVACSECMRNTLQLVRACPWCQGKRPTSTPGTMLNQLAMPWGGVALSPFHPHHRPMLSVMIKIMGASAIAHSRRKIAPIDRTPTQPPEAKNVAGNCGTEGFFLVNSPPPCGTTIRSYILQEANLNTARKSFVPTLTKKMATKDYEASAKLAKFPFEAYWPIKKLKICVTGAGGFIASHLAKRLKSEGHYIVACDWKRNEHMQVRAAGWSGYCKTRLTCFQLRLLKTAQATQTLPSPRTLPSCRKRASATNSTWWICASSTIARKCATVASMCSTWPPTWEVSDRRPCIWPSCQSSFGLSPSSFARSLPNRSAVRFQKHTALFAGLPEVPSRLQAPSLYPRPLLPPPPLLPPQAWASSSPTTPSSCTTTP